MIYLIVAGVVSSLFLNYLVKTAPSFSNSGTQTCKASKEQSTQTCKSSSEKSTQTEEFPFYQSDFMQIDNSFYVDFS